MVYACIVASYLMCVWLGRRVSEIFWSPNVTSSALLTKSDKAHNGTMLHTIRIFEMVQIRGKAQWQQWQASNLKENWGQTKPTHSGNVKCECTTSLQIWFELKFSTSTCIFQVSKNISVCHCLSLSWTQGAWTLLERRHGTKYVQAQASGWLWKGFGICKSSCNSQFGDLSGEHVWPESCEVEALNIEGYGRWWKSMESIQLGSSETTSDSALTVL